MTDGRFGTEINGKSWKSMEIKEVMSDYESLWVILSACVSATIDSEWLWVIMSHFEWLWEIVRDCDYEWVSVIMSDCESLWVTATDDE